MKQRGKTIILTIRRPVKKGYSQICFALAVCLCKIELRFDHREYCQSREACYGLNCQLLIVMGRILLFLISQ